MKPILKNYAITFFLATLIFYLVTVEYASNCDINPIAIEIITFTIIIAIEIPKAINFSANKLALSESDYKYNKSKNNV